MSYGKGNLISLDYTFEVDTSNLDTRLDEIEQKIADLGGEDILDEDRVQGIIDNAGYITSDDLDGRGYAARDDVDQIVRDLMHSEGDDFVQGVIDNGSYVTEYDLDEKLRYLDTDLDEDAVRTIVESVTDGRFHKLEQRFDDERSIESLAERVDALESRTREYDSELADLSVLAQRVDLQNQRIADLETRLADRGELGMALTFFGLLRQAFAALR